MKPDAQCFQDNYIELLSIVLLNQCFPIFQVHENLLEGGLAPTFPDPIGLGESLRICVSKGFPGGAAGIKRNTASGNKITERNSFFRLNVS